MSKKVARDQKVVLYGVDITTVLRRWAVDATIGDIVRLEVDILSEFVRTHRIRPRGLKAQRVTDHANVYVSNNGVQWSDDIAKHVYGWDIITQVGELDVVRIHLYADSEVMSINGGAPWEHQ